MKKDKIEHIERLLSSQKKSGLNPAGYFKQDGKFYYQSAPGEDMTEISREQFLKETEQGGVPPISWQ